MLLSDDGHLGWVSGWQSLKTVSPMSSEICTIMGEMYLLQINVYCIEHLGSSLNCGATKPFKTIHLCKCL